MRKFLLSFLALGFLCSGILAQDLSNQSRIDSLFMQVDALGERTDSLDGYLQGVKGSIKKLQKEYSVFVDNIGIINDNTQQRITVLEKMTKDQISTLEQQLKATSEKSETGLSELNASLSNNTIFWIIATSFAVLLAIALFLLLSRIIKTKEQKTYQQLNVTRKALEEEGIKLDGKLIELLDNQLKIKEATPHTEVVVEKDHSLALKVADEIVRIQKNLAMMDDETKGKKQLSASVERIRSNFEANGYEIVDMLNKPYHEGMKVQANFRPDDTLEPGQQLITRIIKPQINFEGIMIQSAQIEVSQGQQ